MEFNRKINLFSKKNHNFFFFMICGVSLCILMIVIYIRNRGLTLFNINLCENIKFIFLMIITIFLFKIFFLGTLFLIYGYFKYVIKFFFLCLLLFCLGFFCYSQPLFLCDLLITFMFISIIFNVILMIYDGPIQYFQFWKKFSQSEEKFFPKLYILIYNSLLFRVLRLVCSFLTFYYIIINKNITIKNKYDVFAFFIEQINNKNFFFIIPFVLVFVIWLLIIIDLLISPIFITLNFFKIIKILSPREEEKIIKMAGFWSHFDTMSKILPVFSRSVGIHAAKTTVRGLGSIVLFNGSLIAIDQNYESNGFKPPFGFIYLPILFWFGLGGHPGNITDQMIKPRENLQFVYGDTLLLQGIRKCQILTESYRTNLGNLKESLPSFYESNENPCEAKNIKGGQIIWPYPSTFNELEDINENKRVDVLKQITEK